MFDTFKKFFKKVVDFIPTPTIAGMEYRVIDKDTPVTEIKVAKFECYMTDDMSYGIIYIVRLVPDGPRLIPFWDQNNLMCVEDIDGKIYRIIF